MPGNDRPEDEGTHHCVPAGGLLRREVRGQVMRRRWATWDHPAFGGHRGFLGCGGKLKLQLMEKERKDQKEKERKECKMEMQGRRNEAEFFWQEVLRDLRSPTSCKYPVSMWLVC